MNLYPKKVKKQENSGGSVVKTPSFHCRGHGFNHGRTKIPHALGHVIKIHIIKFKNN